MLADAWAYALVDTRAAAWEAAWYTMVDDALADASDAAWYAALAAELAAVEALIGSLDKYPDGAFVQLFKLYEM